jgi:hypothetical protein
LQGGSSNLHNRLESFKASVGYVYDHTYSLTAAYFDVRGSADAGLFTNSLTGSPDGQGLIFDAAYLPFSKDGPAVWPWLNARIGVSYTHYLKLFGGSTISMAPSTTPPKTTPFSSIAGLRSDRLLIEQLLDQLGLLCCIRYPIRRAGRKARRGLRQALQQDTHCVCAPMFAGMVTSDRQSIVPATH